MTPNKKIAIVLFNLGGPDKLEAVKPFLFNLFFDKYIIKLPSFFRYFIAWIISFRRESLAKEIYKQIGGRSPIVPETQKQIDALKKTLKTHIKSDFEIFMCMRHWHPMSSEIVKKIESYNPTEVILLPLYPQFSTTTSGSSIEDFIEALKKNKINATRKTICCYPKEDSFIKSHVDLIQKGIKKVKNKDNYRILFSAHGLPENVINAGDPYQWQIESTVSSVVAKLGQDNLDYKVSYQSKVGPLKWIGPNTEDEIKIASEQKKELIIVPIAFVSEHVETLVELDVEYKEIADESGINYIRIPTLSVNELFIKSLENIIIKASQEGGSFLLSNEMKRICPSYSKSCPCRV
ncbi:MAG: ferrochelatase [Rickettsiaceae bacterium]|nr:ferrochelatase [Rickettsiaceae bacterium]